jgi:hypothetical protein
MRYSGVVLLLAQSSLAAPFCFHFGHYFGASLSGKRLHDYRASPDYPI